MVFIKQTNHLQGGGEVEVKSQVFLPACHERKFNTGWPESRIITMGQLSCDLYKMSWLLAYGVMSIDFVI